MTVTNAHEFDIALELLVYVVCEEFTVEESIKVLDILDRARRRIDRIQANPRGRPMTTDPEEVRPEREGREGDTQPMPLPVDGPVMHDLVIADLKSRLEVGIRRYGQPLRAFNGRDPLVDLYEELLDACVYLRQAIEERSARPEPAGTPDA